MLFVSWNVNGIRACLRKGFLNFLREYSPNVLAIQEIKADEKSIPAEVKNFPEYYIFLNPAKKRGYAGTAVFSRLKPINIYYGLGNDIFDEEGRVITAEFDKFYLVNIYFPNSRHDLSRLDFKVDFDRNIHRYMNSLREIKPVVICGDFNVAHKEIDLANPKQNMKNAGFTPEERAWMDDFIEDGWIDTFRMFTKEGGHYTWWSYRFNARVRNIGWRVDYFIVSPDLKNKIKKSWILSDVMGSDHAPIAMEIDI